jgi:hypothetical protein
MNGHDYNNEKFNRIVKQSDKEMIGISLMDIDTVVAKYMEESVIPELEQNGKKIKVPIIYGNAERWKNAQRDGYLRDKEGRIQIPLVMFKRNSIAKNENVKFLKEEAVTYPTVKKYSKKNTYDRFSLLNPNFAQRYETFDVRMPEYVNLSYEVVVWTNYTEHNNTIVEKFSYSADQYWGEKDKSDRYKFRTTIDSFDTTQEVTAGNERVIKTTFTIVVYAYILPKEIGSVPTTLKGITNRTVVVTRESVEKIENRKDFDNISGERYIDKWS